MQRYGLIWQREGIEQDRARNQDYVVLDLDPALSTAPQDEAGGRNNPVHARLIDAIAKQAASVPADGLLFPTIGNPDSYGDAIRADIMDALGMPGMKDRATGKRPSSSVLVPCHSFRHSFVTETTGLPGEIANSDVKNYPAGHAEESVRKDYGEQKLAVVRKAVDAMWQGVAV